MKQCITIFLLLLSLFCQALAGPKPLEPNQAFQLSASARDAQTLLLHFSIAPGYYLYQDDIHVAPLQANTITLGRLLRPITNQTIHTINGTETVYDGQVTIAVPVLSHTGSHASIRVHYQGCSSYGYCYPPQNRNISVNMKAGYGTRVAATQSTSKPTSAITTLLSNSSLAWIALAFLGFGLLISLTPCILPMIPILSSIIMGQQHKSQHRWHGFFLSLAYVLGMSITYAIAGIIFGLIGENIQSALQQPWLLVSFAVLFVLLALAMFGFYELELPRQWQHRLHQSSNKKTHGRFFGVMLMGAIASLVMSPCVTPPLVGALSFISSTGSPVTGAVALFALGFGMGLPLLIIGSTSTTLLPKSGPWMQTIKNTIGVMLMAVAISLVTRITPAWLSASLWTVFALALSIAFGSFGQAEGLWAMIKKIIGIALFIYAILMSNNILHQRYDITRPFYLGTTTAQHAVKFIPVHSLTEIQQQLALAQKHQQRVMLDFYANWCVSCKEMERFTFGNPQVQDILKPFRLLQVDLSQSTPETKKIEAHYGIIAPPTLLFFNNGKEIPGSRLIGNTPAPAFIHHINSITSI